jgi:hypothetical protein
MTNEEVDVLVARAQRVSGAGAQSDSNYLWMVAGITLVLSPVNAPLLLPTTFVLGVIALVVRSAGREAHLRWREDFALRVWHYVAHQEPCFQVDSSEFNALKAKIALIYASDPQGHTFPVHQAIKLLEAFSRQQKRLTRVLSHIALLHRQRDELSQRLARLHELGEDNPTGRARLKRLDTDIFALETSTLSIQASCSRLEAIVDKVRQTVEVKKLHREINQLSLSETALASELQSEEANDIERQIAREIETFLRLERETDEHLRDV